MCLEDMIKVVTQKTKEIFWSCLNFWHPTILKLNKSFRQNSKKCQICFTKNLKGIYTCFWHKSAEYNSRENCDAKYCLIIDKTRDISKKKRANENCS